MKYFNLKDKELWQDLATILIFGFAVFWAMMFMVVITGLMFWGIWEIIKVW